MLISNSVRVDQIERLKRVDSILWDLLIFSLMAKDICYSKELLMTESEKRFACGIGIDMGAKYTGVFYTLHGQGELPNGANSKALTLALPEPGPVYMQTNRTAVRHRLRGKKRYALVRRLVFLIVDAVMKQHGSVLTEDEWRRGREALSGLLKRRGYSRPNADGEDLTPLEEVRADVFAAHPVLGLYFSDARSLAEQWEDLTADLANARKFLDDEQIPDEKDFAAFAVKEGLIDKSEKTAYQKALSTLKANASNLCELRVLGHKSRSEYFKAIRADLEKDTRLTKIALAFGGVERLARLLGHLSNLQLRAERWYFNAPHLMKSRGWEPEYFRKTLVRAFKYCHPAQDKNKQHLELIAKLEASKDVIDTLCTLDPELTIPPYEDQNNRRPPVDQTLLLSPEKLTKRYGDVWQGWAQRLAAACPALVPAADILERSTDRKSRSAVNGRAPLPTTVYQLSYALQRAFDRSKGLDPYALRALAASRQGNQITSAREALERSIGSQHIEQFLDCAKRYYREVNDAKVGLWFDNADGLLERSNLHPPMKKKILSLLVANILMADEAVGQKFLQEVWHLPIKGRQTTASRCARIEAVRKSIGGGFNIAYNKALYKKKNKSTCDVQDENLLKIHDLVEETADFIAEKLHLSDEQKRKFANPYSLAQLYTLIETDVSGFSSTTLAVHLENAWRMTMSETTVDGETVRTAQCSRLPAESARPFDGLIRRLIDRQAWEIAKRAAADIRNTVQFRNGAVDVSIFVEENKFDFSASVADLKKNKRAKDKLLAEGEKVKERWLDKDKRIRNASRNLSAYSDKKLPDNNGEIDHILPRSLLKDSRGVVFNAEPNLIYVLPEDNRDKGNQRYGLGKLKSNYLQAVFHTTDKTAVAAEIERVVAELLKTGRLTFFDLLSEHEQDCVRHALFLDDASVARKAVLHFLETQRKARVNGTQIWMIRNLTAKIKQELTAWCQDTGNDLSFHAATTDVSSAKLLRSKLTDLDADFDKPTIQPVASHSVDAFCSFVVGAADTAIGSERDFYDEAGVVFGIYPQACEVIRLQAKPVEDKSNFGGVAIFKEGIYAENFLPVFTLNGKIWVGFETLNSERNRCGAVEVSGKKPEELLAILAPFFEKPIGDLAAHKTYRIQKKPAYELLTKAALEPLSDLEKRQAALLDELRYCTTRKSLLNVFMAANGKALKTREEVLKTDKFQLKVELKGEKSFKLKGVLTLPLKDEWVRICNSPEFVDAFGKACTAGHLVQKLQRVWRRPEKRDIAHAPVRRDFSLPALDQPSGGFRIRRTNLFGEQLYQVHAINAKKYRGFAAVNVKVDWSHGVLFNELQRTNLTECGGRFSEAVEVTPMLQWRQVLQQKDLTVWVAPGTEGRRYLRVETTFELANKWFEQSVDDWKATSPLSLTSSFKVTKTKVFQDAVGEDLKDLLGQPRSEIFIEQVDNSRLRFWYIVTSSSQRMKESYNSVANS